MDKPFIKVINGIRRSGKSSVLLLVKDELTRRDIEASQIIHINFESLRFQPYLEYLEFYKFIKSQIISKKKYYLLLDEVQEVDSWEKAVNSFLVDFNVDIYITGSNSRLMSSDLSTYLAGRYVEFHVQTLSFREAILFAETRGHKVENIDEFFDYYRRMGGFPSLYIADYDFDSAYKIILDIYSSIVLRDTIQRFGIRDIEMLERVVRFIYDHVGSSFSAHSISKFFKSQFRKLDINTIYNYLHALESAFIVYRVPRYDIKGKEILKTQEKYYVGDIGLIYSMMGYRDTQISGILENLVMLELKRKGYRVYVGKIGTTEIDFVAEKKGYKVYIQVTYQMELESTVEREYKPLLSIKDNFPKYIVSMDRKWQDNYQGIKHIFIADFLLMEKLN